jgi:hypothetical protein
MFSVIGYVLCGLSLFPITVSLLAILISRDFINGIYWLVSGILMLGIGKLMEEKWIKTTN